MQIHSQRANLFLQTTKNDYITIKFMKYKHFIKKFRQDAQTIKKQMMQLSLRNGMIGEYDDIDRLFNTNNVIKDNRYKQLRQEYVLTSNKLRTQLQQNQQIDNVQQTAHLNLALAQINSKVGYHSQSDLYYKKLYKIQSIKNPIKFQAYFEKWATQLFYLQSYSELLTFISVQFDNNIKKNMVNLALVRDLKLIQMKKPNVFENLIGLKFSLSVIADNHIISTQDLGFLYSICSLLNSQRINLKRDIRWSSQIESYYLRGDYQGFLKQFQKCKIVRRFNPLIDLIVDDYSERITHKILKEIFNSHISIPFVKVSQMTGLKQGFITLFIKENKELPFYFDPTSQSIVHVPNNNVEFYRQVEKYQASIQQIFKEKVKTLVEPQKMDMDDRFGGMGGLGGLSGLSRMGGMGGMSGMSRMGGMGGMGRKGFEKHHERHRRDGADSDDD